MIRLIACLVLALTAVAAAGPAQAREALTNRGAGNPAPPLVEDWEEAYNSGDPAAMRAFAEGAFTAAALAELGGASELIESWQLDRRRYGEVRYVLSEGSGDSEIHWFRTDPARAWLGLRLWRDSADSTRLAGYGIRRGSAPRDPPPLPNVEDLGDHVSRYLDALAAEDMFSGAALVARGSEILHAGGYALADLDGRANTPNTRFNIASLGKMFTAVAILQLVEQGRLSLDDSLSQHVPEFPARIADRVTVRDLLLHTSGIELDDIPQFNGRMLEASSVGQILEAQLAHIEGIEISPPPREFDYTNEGINLLGVIIERLSGRDYCDYLSERVFGPAGMTRSSCTAEPGTAARGFMYVEGQPTAPRVSNDSHLPPRAYPAGAHFSTVGDLYLFHRALMEGRLLGQALRHAAMSVQVVEAEAQGLLYAYGYGFEIQERNGMRMVGHSGGMEGVSARYEYFPTLDVLVVALSNYDTSAVIFASHMRDVLSASAGPGGAAP